MKKNVLLNVKRQFQSRLLFSWYFHRFTFRSRVRIASYLKDNVILLYIYTVLCVKINALMLFNLIQTMTMEAIGY